MIALRLQSSDSTTSAALAAAVSRQGWCEALRAALGSGYRVVWRDAGDAARVTLTMSGTLPISEQRVQISAQPAAVSCSSGTPTKTLLESADGARWALLERMVPLVDSTGSPLAPVDGAGFRWVDPLVVLPPAGLSALPAWLQDAPLMTWQSIPGTRLDSVLNPLSYAGGTDTNGILAYSGGAVCGTELVIIGGGHNNWFGNDVYGIDFSLDAPQWVQRFVGTPSSSFGPSADWEASGYFADGRPTSRHTRWTLQHDPSRGKVFLFGNAGMGSNVTDPAKWPKSQVDAFDLTANDYDPANTWPDLARIVGAGDGFARDGNGDFWWTSNSKLHRAPKSTMSWAQVSPGDLSGAVPADTALMYDPARNRLFQTRTAYQPTKGRVLDLAAITSGMPAESLVTYSGSAAGSLNTTAAVTYCGDRDSYLVIPYNSTTIYEIDPDTWSVEPLGIAGTPPNTQPRNTDWYDRFAWYPELRCVIVAGLQNQGVHYFRTA